VTTYIYGTGAMNNMKFDLTSSRGAVPQGATLYAICQTKGHTRAIVERAFRSVTVQQHSQSQAPITQAQRSEAVRSYLSGAKTVGLLQRLCESFAEFCSLVVQRLRGANANGMRANRKPLGQTM
jgi:hypothetical protein